MAIQGIRIAFPRQGAGYVKMFFDVEVDIRDEDGNVVTTLRTKDWELRETKDGDLYAKQPQKGATEKDPNRTGHYRVRTQKDNAEKPMFIDTVALQSVKEGEEYKLSKGALALKDALNNLAKAAYAGLGGASTGGSRQAAVRRAPARQAPANAGAVIGATDDDLPF